MLVHFFYLQQLQEQGQGKPLKYQGDENDHESNKQDQVTVGEYFTACEGERDSQGGSQRYHPPHAGPAHDERQLEAGTSLAGPDILIQKTRDIKSKIY